MVWRGNDQSSKRALTHLILRNQRVLINLAHNVMDIEKLQTGVPIYLEKEQLATMKGAEPSPTPTQVPPTPTT